MSETESDVHNLEAWAVLLGHALHLVPEDDRLRVLELAGAHEQAEAAERAKSGGLRVLSYREMCDPNAPGLRHWNAVCA